MNLTQLGITGAPQWLEEIFKVEYSLDYFTGWRVGDFPYYSPEVYRANVHDLKVQGSVNLT